MINNHENHEIVDLFSTKLYPLNTKLVEMLNEHYSHQTERRGCGYTQATRVLSDYINRPRYDDQFDDLLLFDHYNHAELSMILKEAHQYNLMINSWRNLDKNQQVIDFLEHYPKKESEFYQILKKQYQFQHTLRTLHEYASLEESQLICQFIQDIILPKTAEEYGYIELNNLTEKPKVGSCPMAENFFLKIAHETLLRQGSINIFVDKKQHAVMIEKLKMGDDHSCMNLVPVIKNGVRLPAGCLFSVDYPDDQVKKQPNKKYKGFVIPIDEVEGFWMLRITTLAISPKYRARAFSTHFKQQVQNGLFNPEHTTLEQLYTVANMQI